MIRDFETDDMDALKKIHASQGFDYNCPDLSRPLFLVKKVREVNGRVVAAMAVRLTLETFLLVEGSPVAKGRAIEELQPEVLREAYEKGLDDLFCVIPPEIAESFAPALEKLGWSKERDWPLYSRSLDAIGSQPSEQRVQPGE